MIHIKRNNYFDLQNIFVAMCRHLFGCNSASNKFKIWMYASNRDEKKTQPSELLLTSFCSFLCLLAQSSPQLHRWRR